MQMLIAFIPRQVHFLIAAKSLRRKVVGSLARMAACIGVRRSEDEAKKGCGRIRVSALVHAHEPEVAETSTGETSQHLNKTITKERPSDRKNLQGPQGEGHLPSASPSLSGALSPKDFVQGHPRTADGAAGEEQPKVPMEVLVEGKDTRFLETVKCGDTITTADASLVIRRILSNERIVAETQVACVQTPTTTETEPLSRKQSCRFDEQQWFGRGLCYSVESNALKPLDGVPKKGGFTEANDVASEDARNAHTGGSVAESSETSVATPLQANGSKSARQSVELHNSEGRSEGLRRRHVVGFAAVADAENSAESPRTGAGAETAQAAATCIKSAKDPIEEAEPNYVEYKVRSFCTAGRRQGGLGVCEL